MRQIFTKSNGKKTPSPGGMLRLFVALLLTFVTISKSDAANRPTLTHVNFEGAHAIRQDVLRNALVQRTGMPLDSALVIADMKHILTLYRSKGYWQAAVHFPEVVVNNGRATLRYGLREGVRTHIDSFIVHGDTLFPPDSLAGLIGTGGEKVLTEERLNDHMNSILTFYENRGYPFCEVEPHITFRNETSSVTVDLRTGPLCQVDTLVFVGNAVTRVGVLLREMRLDRGVVYDQRQVDRAVRYLRQLPFLLSVDDPVVRRKDGRTEVIIRVEESRTALLEGAVGYAPQTSGGGLTGSFALDILNITGAGRLGRISWQRTNVRSTQLHIRIEEPWVLGEPLSANAELSMGERPGYSEWVFGVGTTMRFWETTALKAQVLRGGVLPDSSGIGVYGRSSRWTLALAGRMDTSDDQWNPRRGWVGEVSFDLSRVEGDTPSALRRLTGIKAEVYRPTGERTVLMVGARGQWVSQVGGVPQEAQIPVGGARSIRGYREEAFLATEVTWVSAEWRYLIGNRSRLYAFVDAAILKGVTGRTAASGYGGGLAVQSQVGMIGLDVAWSRDDHFGDGKIHLKVMNAF